MEDPDLLTALTDAIDQTVVPFRTPLNGDTAQARILARYLERVGPGTLMLALQHVSPDFVDQFFA